MSCTAHLFVAGALAQRTGGYLYDARMVRGLQGLGWTLQVHELPGTYPLPDADDLGIFRQRLQSLPDGTLAVVDGLAGGAQPALLYAQAARLRLVALVHHPLGDETGLPAPERRRLLQLEADGLRAPRGVIVTSGFSADRLDALGVRRPRVRIVEPGVDQPPPRQGPSQVRAADAGPRLLCVGSLTPRKGQDLLIEALAGLRARPWQAWLVGSRTRNPGFAAALARRLRELGLSRRIVLTGELPAVELAAHLRQADLFVLPSWYEGYGMALTEALVHGLPVISTTGGAIPHTLPGDAGLLVPPGDIAALGQALRVFLDHPDRRRHAAERALAHAATLPDWPTQARRFADALTELGALNPLPRRRTEDAD
ncbi:glycosyltransferase family 4 protein [Thiohalocapsa marina]|uniref:glycosyltransferase family 4 protein n=1 Tax=Thiohalocapsa marina TaxID=424902 RepID=UPI0036DAB7D1